MSLKWDERNGPEGTHAKNAFFDQTLPDGSTQKISVFDYFLEKYSIRLRYPHWPVIQTFKGELFPMELCLISENQRYAPKLDPDQVSWL